MIRITLTILCCFIIGVSAATPRAVKMVFKDGFDLDGFAEITEDDKIDFQTELDQPSEIFDHTDIKRIEFLEKPFYKLDYVKFENKGFRLVRLITEGEFSLYALPMNSFSTLVSPRREAKEDYLNAEELTINNGVFNSSGNITRFYKIVGRDGKTYTYTEYPGPSNGIANFVLVRKNQTAKRVVLRGFRKKMMSLFQDCPYLVELIETREWKFSNFQLIVEYYNEMCAEQ